MIKDNKYHFPCGCSFDIIGPPPFPKSNIPALKFNPDLRDNDHDINFNCPATYRLLSGGKTTGIFQLETPLGKKYSSDLGIDSFPLVGAITAILRPGTLKAKDSEGISMTDHFIRRKNGREEVSSFHPVIDEILKETYGCLIYQEQSMRIVKETAGFNLIESDNLRKAIGRKLPEEMSKVRKLYIEKAKECKILTEEQAEEVFDWIEKSQRFQFNACLRGDTRILPGKPIKYWWTIEEAYNSQTDDYGWGFSLYENKEIKPNRIIDIKYSGIQEVFRISLVEEKYIDVTINHKFPTPKGEFPLYQLKIGNLLYVKGDRFYQKDTPLTAKILSIESIGYDHTYDVTMDAPNHNFVSEYGIVTCNSHAIGYGTTTYITAYEKAHFPLIFFRSWLEFAREKQEPLEEIKGLVQDAHFFGVDVDVPRLELLNKNFYTDGQTIYFGITDIKGIGESQFEKLELVLGDDYSIKSGWTNFLLQYSNYLSSTCVENLIKCGAMASFGLHRQYMLTEYNYFNQLTKGEKSWVGENCSAATSLREAFVKLARIKKIGGGCHTQQRVDFINGLISLIDKPLISNKDTVDQIIYWEEDLLGIPISHSKLENIEMANATHTSKDVLNGKKGYCVVVGEISRISKIKTKTGKAPGKKMAFITLRDNDGILDNVVVFPNIYSEYEDLLYDGNIVFLSGKVNQQGSFQVEKVYNAK